jgi:drug/metabolite transporter (DMT)-like permease
MLCATAVMFIGRNSNKAKTEAENESKTEKRKKLIIVLSTLAFMSLIGAASTAVLKYYSADTNVTDQNSFFFITNIFSAFLVLPVLPFTMKRDKIKPSDLWKMVKSKKTIYSAVTTLNSNINSVVQLLLLGMMDVSIYTPLSSAFAFAAVAVATPIIGEKLNRYTIIATVFAILSVVLPAVIF